MMDDPDHLRTGPRWLDAACHRRGMGGRGGRRSGGGGRRVPASPLALGAAGATYYWRSPGITEALGAIPSWDSEGSNTARIQQATTTKQPAAIAQGAYDPIASFDGATTNPDALVSATTQTLVRPYTYALVFAIPSNILATSFIFDPDSVAGRTYLAIIPGNKVRILDNLKQVDTVTALTAGAFVSVIVRSNTLPSGASGNTYLLLNGALEATGTAVAARTESASSWTFGTRSDAAFPGKIKLVEFALWSGEYLSDTAVTKLDAWHSYVKGRL